MTYTTKEDLATSPIRMTNHKALIVCISLKLYTGIGISELNLYNVAHCMAVVKQ